MLLPKSAEAVNLPIDVVRKTLVNQSDSIRAYTVLDSEKSL